ncbi:MAG: threonine/serine ThrE exporter family protein [Janthinobacterium lividum]
MTGTDEHSAQEIRTLLVHLGSAMVATGQPINEVEDELAEVAVALGHPDAQIAAGPTGVTLALASGAPSTYEVVTGALRLDQSAQVRGIRRDLLQARVDGPTALGLLLALRSQPPRYPVWLANLGWVATAVGIALILQPGWRNVTLAAVASVVVVGLFRAAQRFRLLSTLLPVVAAFVVACLVFAAADLGLVEGPLRTLLPPLAVLLPGALIVTAMSELAAGDMVAGSSRLTFGLVQVLLFTLGIVGASRLFDLPPGMLQNVRVAELGWWAAPVGLVLVCVGVGLLESPPVRLLPWILLVLVLAFGAQALGQHYSGPVLGSFLGAVAASVGSYLVEAFVPDLPRLVVFLPSFWLLVPGSLGVLSATQLALDPAGATANVLGVVTVVCALALGLLVGTAGAQSARGALRRARHRRHRGHLPLDHRERSDDRLG